VQLQCCLQTSEFFVNLHIANTPGSLLWTDAVSSLRVMFGAYSWLTVAVSRWPGRPKGVTRVDKLITFNLEDEVEIKKTLFSRWQQA
jgi:hypothetical protein